ncbi:MAG: hypothetical protein Fur006_49080 [Coleofasciculaceae cyanobacterium]
MNNNEPLQAQSTQREEKESFTHHLDWIYRVTINKGKYEDNELLPKTISVQLLDERAAFRPV